jgi:hypothetical protein
MFCPFLNSDHAIAVMMIHYYELPHDIYAWGMNRMGTLIPLISQIFYHVLNLSPLLSESIVHYAILLLGCLSFIHFIKSPFLKIIFAIVWFIPPMRLIDVTQFAFGIHYSLIAMACYLFDCSQKEKIRQCKFSRHAILSLIVLLLIAVIWVSDMALVSVFLLLAVQLYFYLKKNPISFSMLKKAELYYALAGIVLGILFIHYGKSHSSSHYKYATFCTLKQLIHNVSYLGTSIRDFFVFRTPELFSSIHVYLVVIVLIFLATQIKKIKLNENVKKWFLIFFLDAILILGIILISRWTYYNDVPRRYFTCPYISFSFAIILLFDNLNIQRKSRIALHVFLLTTVLMASIGTFYSLKYKWPQTLTPKVERGRALDKLGKIGIIADFWESYVNSCHNPELIKAIPHETSSVVVDNRVIKDVFEQKNIYVIKNRWLQSCPDTINEYGRMLIKDGDEFKIGDYEVCKYLKQ